MIACNDLRPGTRFLLDGAVYQVIEYQHHKPGKGGAMVRTKLRNLKTGATVDRTFRPEEKFPLAEIEERKLQFLYRQGEAFHFMDTSNYEQLSLPSSQLGSAPNYLKEGAIISIQFHHQEPVEVLLPIFVELQVTKSDPGIRGDTASGGSKPATLETGMVIQVPLFIEEGDIVKVDTRTGSYSERG
ncbi:MAG: elongation factor P [bacterium]